MANVLKLVAFRVQNFKSVEDSGWVEVGQITAFVGKNEAGKSNLLQALHRLKPADGTRLIPQVDFPRNRFTADYKKDRWPAVSGRFEILEGGVELIRELLGDKKPPAHVVYTRYYEKDSVLGELDPVPSEDTIPKDHIEGIVRKLKRDGARFAPDGVAQEVAEATRSSVLGLAQKLEAIVQQGPTNWRGDAGAKLLDQLHAAVAAAITPQSKPLLESVLDALESATDLAKKPEIQNETIKRLWPHVPQFIYFEDYSVVSTTIYLPSFVEKVSVDRPATETRTINALFRHVGLSAKDLLDLGTETSPSLRGQNSQAFDQAVRVEEERKHLRSIKVSSASQEMTRKFGEWWHVRTYQFRYHADGNHFRIWVYDDKRRDEIELESRSRGLQWFFWFYLVFLVESEDGHKDSVLLLDEPGLHLHPTAQKDLVSFLEDISSRNQLLYTTHLPFLINGSHLDRVRVVSDDERGITRVSRDVWPKDKDALFPLQAALGYSIMQTLFLGQKVVLVEGMTDYWILHAINPQLVESGREHIPEDVTIVPGEGTRKIGYLASLFLSQGERPVVLLDGDKAGTTKAREFAREQYLGHEGRLVILDGVLGREPACIEDIFTADMYAKAVSEVAGKPISVSPEDGTGGVSTRVGNAAKRLGVVLPELWRVSAARVLSRRLSAMHHTEVDAFVLDAAARVAAALRRALASDERPDEGPSNGR